MYAKLVKISALAGLLAASTFACATAQAQDMEGDGAMHRHMMHRMMRHEMMRHEMHREMHRHMMHRMMHDNMMHDSM